MVKSSHQLTDILDHEDSRVMRVTFANGNVFRLKEFEQVDPSIYGDTDRWCTCREAVGGSHPDFKRLFLPGSLLDLHKSDIAEVLDEASGKSVTMSLVQAIAGIEFSALSQFFTAFFLRRHSSSEPRAADGLMGCRDWAGTIPGCGFGWVPPQFGSFGPWSFRFIRDDQSCASL